MSGRCIDRAALTAVTVTGLYLFFLNAGFGIPISMLLAFVCAVLTQYIYQHRPWRDRVTRGQALAALHAISRMPDQEARDALTRLTSCSDGVFMIRYPGDRLSEAEIFRLWRERMGREALTLVTTCPAEEGAVSLAAALKQPSIDLIDSAALMKQIRATGLYVSPDEPSEPLRARLSRALGRFRRPPDLRTALCGLSLLAVYLTTGRPLCLLAGLTVIGITGMRWIHRLT